MNELIEAIERMAGLSPELQAKLLASVVIRKAHTIGYLE